MRKIIWGKNLEVDKYRYFFLGYIVCFIFGIVCANYFWDNRLDEMKLLGFDTLYNCANRQIDNETLLLYIARKRYAIYVFLGLSGISVLGTLFVWCFLIVSGFFAGILYTVFLLQFGIKGLWIGLLFLVPQSFFYIPAWCWLIKNVYQTSDRWRKRNHPLQMDYVKYFRDLLKIGVLLLWGIVLESYVNPIILKIFLI